MIKAPLDGVRVVEFGGIGPGPFAAMLLADLGATVVRLHRAGETSPVPMPGGGADHRGRPGLVVDLKSADDRARVLRLVEHADAVIEGFRPGVMERLGYGPDELLARNPQLVYGRITGYGQTGPLADVVGHDINYLAQSGVLSTLAREHGRPLFPLNLLGDYGGGGMLIALGVVAGVLHARATGVGHVVDAAMTEGAAQLATIIFAFAGAGSWGEPGTNVLDSGAPFYEVYETADGGHVAVGAIEPRFYRALLEGLGFEPGEAPQWDRARWPALKQMFAARIATRSRADWVQVFHGTEACVSPVLTTAEARVHPHSVARDSFAAGGGGLPSRAPVFDGAARHDPPVRDLSSVLAEFGLDPAEVAAFDSRAGVA